MCEKEIKVLTPVKAIRAKCMDCSCGSFAEVKRCTVVGCSLYPYRFGKRPKKDSKGNYIEGQISIDDLDLEELEEDEENEDETCTV